MAFGVPVVKGHGLQKQTHDGDASNVYYGSCLPILKQVSVTRVLVIVGQTLFDLRFASVVVPLACCPTSASSL